MVVVVMIKKVTDGGGCDDKKKVTDGAGCGDNKIGRWWWL